MDRSDCICTNLRQAALAATALYDAALAPSGLRVTMFRLLRRIADAPDVTITALADRVGLDRSTLGRNLKVLERQGLVAPASGARRDERCRPLVLTAAGLRALETAVPLWERAQARMRARLGAADPSLMQALRRIASPGDADAGETHDAR